MTNEEPVPSTSSVLSSAEKNVKIVNGSKKRKGLDIDALWRKKFKDVENEKSPEKAPEKTDEQPTVKQVSTPVSSQNSTSKEKPKELEQKSTSTVVSPSENKISQSTRSTRSSKRKEEKDKMEELADKDVKPNIKLLKKSAPVSFQCSEIDDGVVGDVAGNSAMIVDPSKITLHSTSNYGEESQDEMEVMQRSADDPNGTTGEDYEYAQMEYTSAVTPNGTYALYAPDTTYAQYYPYQNNMQASPQETGAYIVPAAPQSPDSIDDQSSVSLPNNQRASPATVNWLFENYEIAEGSSLPRCELYKHYTIHCKEHRMDPVNAASFGKLIRSVFQNLKTRRLGTRGNSKYHYYGIRMKDNSVLHAMPLPNQVNTQYTPPVQMVPRDAYSETINSVAAVKYVDVEIPAKRSRKEHSSSSSSCRESASPAIEIPVQPTLQQTTPVGVIPEPLPAVIHYKFTQGDRAAVGKLELHSVPFQNEEDLLSSMGFRKIGLGSADFKNLMECYDSMCREVLDLVKNLDFAAVEEVWEKFWTGELGVNQEHLLALCSLDKIQDYMIDMDITLYQTIVDCLIPHVLLSQLTIGMTQAIRTFGKNVDVYLKNALQNGKMLDPFINKKIQAIRYMQQGIKRYTSLNHLAHASRGVLMKIDQVEQMYHDYIRVDINAVHQQAGWICGCDSVMVNQLNDDFKRKIRKMCPMETWAEWLEGIVDQVLAKYHDKPAHVVSNVGKQFLLNWSFYTSMIIRDLTLRSAASFGSFTLVRLLADDYMYYLIESKIAKASKQHLITVIRQDKDWSLSKDAQEYIVPANDEDFDLVKNGLL